MYSDWQTVEREGIGFCAKRHALYVFKKRKIYVFKTAPAPFAPACLRKVKGEGWTFCRGDEAIDLVAMQRIVDEYRHRLNQAMLEEHTGEIQMVWRHDAFEQFLASLDQAALKTVLSVAPTQGSWPLYCTLVRTPDTKRLVHTKALLWCLSRAWIFLDYRVSNEMRRIRRLSRLSARDLLKLFGFPPSRSTLRIMRRLSPACMTPRHLLRLRQIMDDGHRSAKWLHHLDTLDYDVLFVLGDPRLRERCTLAFIEDLIAEKEPRAVVHYLRDTLRMLGDETLPMLRSVNGLRAFHDGLAAVSGGADLDNVLFPRPPYAGVPGEIEPILSSIALRAEGIAQHNCLAGAQHWCREICDGQYYVYRILKPQRASLGLMRSPGGSWGIDQVYGAQNQPSPQAVHTVTRWLLAQDTAHSSQRPHPHICGPRVDDVADDRQLHFPWEVPRLNP